MNIVGNYGKTIYRDYKTGRTIFTFNTKDIKPNKVTCLGSCQIYPSDMPLMLEGELKDGQFYFVKCAPYINTREKMINFLASDTFKGIGEKTAEKIYDFVDGNIFDFVMQEDAEAELACEFNSKIAKEIVSKTKALSRVSRIYEIIVTYGGTMTAAIKIGDIVEVDGFLSDVYKIGSICGLTFGCCDGIAKSLNYSPFDVRRLDALVEKAMNDVSSSGHIYTDIAQLTKMVQCICASSAFPDDIPSPVILARAYKDKKYKIRPNAEGARYYQTYLNNAENAIVNGIAKLQQGSSPLPFTEKIIQEIEQECGMVYSDSQKKSLRLLNSSGLKILTGGPGTGKSTVINGIVKAIKKMFPDERPLLCAPTGRAAQRLKEVTGVPSFTVHRALGITPYGDDLVCMAPVEAKFIIVDEASMIDTMLMKLLFDVIDSSSFVLLCGDVDQLPSVGPGNVLNDMIESKKIEVVKLDVVYRCLTDSLISYNANNIRLSNTDMRTGKDFHFFSFPTEQDVKSKVSDIVKERHKKHDPFALQVLSPTKDGEAGTKSLNNILQIICNEDGKRGATFDSYKYQISDKIIMMRNNYAEGYFNGDVGVVTAIDENTMTVRLGDEKDIILKNTELEDVAPAYALTVHKSQGSEFQTVVVVLPENPTCMLQKNLLYTAITRAKKEVFIVAQNNAYERAVQNIKTIERKTSLREKIEKGEFIYD